ncbi:hypothetical protein D806_008280 [Mycolicibacterium smegmatis MKD8]|uniref:Peptidase M50 n=1 Tax=Mycolicibacterium smegmatis (strain MKD8) TaxID=1214915 RepID=A0A2U9PJF0_MYCSE|nr:hypothetical protein D806_008280 [Mycolicibacterium smegmatis MKD8]
MTSSTAVFAGETGPVPRPLRGLPTVGIDDVYAHHRVIVTGSAGDLAAVLTRLLKADRLDVEVAHARTSWSARRALRGTARRVPLIRDETGTVLVSAAEWHGKEAAPLEGEAIVDDTVLFDGQAHGVRIEPLDAVPGLRASVLSRRGRPLGWVSGRAAQLGTPGAVVVRDGATMARPVRRSTFYRHTQGWLRVG